jgi:hypothetical protein
MITLAMILAQVNLASSQTITLAATTCGATAASN